MGHRGRLTAPLVTMALLFLAGTARAGPTSYSGLVIEEILFEAPADVAVEDLRYLVELEVGDVYRPRDARRSLELLYSLGVFQEVYVTVVPDGASLIVQFHLVPSPTLTRVQLRALPAAIPPARAREVMTPQVGERFFPGDEWEMADALVAFLADEGYLDARVQPAVTEVRAGGRGSARVAASFQIESGPVYRVAAVDFNPGAGFEPKVLRPRVRAGIMEDQRFRRETVEEGRDKLEKFFRRRGHLEARILPPIVEVEPDRQRVDVIYNVVPGPEIEVVFLEVTDGEEGSAPKKIIGPRTVELRQVIGVEREYRLTSGYVQDAEARIIQDFRDRGHADVVVESSLEESPERKLLTFCIEPGEGSVLLSRRDIVIRGNEVIPDREARELIRDRLPVASDQVVPFLRPRVAERALEQAVGDLELRYEAGGYLGAVVQVAEVRRVPTRGLAPRRTWVVLEVVEGARTSVRAIEVHGNRRIASEEIAKLSAPLVGKPLRRPAVHAALDELRELYRDRGYIDITVESDEDFSEDQTEATVIWTIDEGPRVRFGKVVVRGNRHTRMGVIRGELDIEPGRVWRESDLQRSRERLLDTGLFSQVTIRPMHHSGRARDVTIEVAERKRWRLLLGPGISSAEGLRLVAENHLGNIGGVGHRWSTYANVGIDWENLRLLFTSQDRLAETTGIKAEWKIVTAYEFAHIPRVPLRIDVRLLLNERAAQPTYVIQNYGAGVGAILDLDLDQSVTLQILGDFSLLWRYPEDVDPAAVLGAADEVDPEFGSRFLGLIGAERAPDGLRRLGMLKLAAQLDARDDPFNPTEGILTAFDLQGTDPSDLSQEHFGRFKHRFTFYLPLKKWLGAVFGYWPFDFDSSIEWGISWVTHDTEMLPVEWRYRLGGATSVRGYRLETLGPTVERPADLTRAGFTSSTIRVPVGGDVFFSYNVELRQPLTRKGDVELIVFHDGGNVYLLRGEDRPEQDRGLDPVIRTSVGLGVRVRTPVGPVRLDGGVQLGPHSPFFHPALGPWWEGAAIHFSVGAL